MRLLVHDSAPPNNDTLPCLARWKEGNDPTNPKACRQPARSRSAALQEPFPLFRDDSTRYLKASPHLLDAKGGRICLIVSVTLATLHKQRQLSH